MKRQKGENQAKPHKQVSHASHRQQWLAAADGSVSDLWRKILEGRGHTQIKDLHYQGLGLGVCELKGSL